MVSVRRLLGCVALAVVVMLICSWPAAADRYDRGDRSQHLDRYETRKIVRHWEVKNLLLQDRVADWVAERRDEREKRADQMLRDAEHFDENLAQFKIDLYHHQEPWELRDNAHNVLGVASDFGHDIERGDWHSEMQQQWEDMRDTANELARQFHLPELGH
jgi:hypothetical protein